MCECVCVCVCVCEYCQSSSVLVVREKIRLQPLMIEIVTLVHVQ